MRGARIPVDLSSDLPSALARSGLTRRVMWRDDQNLIYQLKDNSGSVRLSREEWVRIGKTLEGRLRPARRAATGLWIGLPFGILFFGMTTAHFLPGGGLILLMLILLGPFAVYLWYSTRVQRISAEIEDELRKFPVASVPVAQAVTRPPRTLEIIALVLFGPQIFTGILGEIVGPNTFRNTPWTGAHLGKVEIAIMAIFSVYLIWRWIAWRQLRR